MLDHCPQDVLRLKANSFVLYYVAHDLSDVSCPIALM